ncbi:MAG: hypothetical protein FVQ83_14640 [Chloroflexi bacterium]|nr:hypothetical protein [Chloroflexota bacterium]
MFWSFAEDGQKLVVQQKVHDFGSVEIAERAFERYFNAGAETDTEGWSYRSDVADQSHIWCYGVQEREYTVCRWRARYEEFVVESSMRLYFDDFTFEDAEEIVRAIDSIMESYLK